MSQGGGNQGGGRLVNQATGFILVWRPLESGGFLGELHYPDESPTGVVLQGATLQELATAAEIEATGLVGTRGAGGDQVAAQGGATTAAAPGRPAAPDPDSLNSPGATPPPPTNAGASASGVFGQLDSVFRSLMAAARQAGTQQAQQGIAEGGLLEQVAEIVRMMRRGERKDQTPTSERARQAEEAAQQSGAPGGRQSASPVQGSGGVRDSGQTWSDRLRRALEAAATSAAQSGEQSQASGETQQGRGARGTQTVWQAVKATAKAAAGAAASSGESKEHEAAGQGGGQGQKKAREHASASGGPSKLGSLQSLLGLAANFLPQGRAATLVKAFATKGGPAGAALGTVAGLASTPQGRSAMFRYGIAPSLAMNPGTAPLVGAAGAAIGAGTFFSTQLTSTQRRVASEGWQSTKKLAFNTVMPGGTFALAAELGKMPAKLAAWGDELLKSQEHLKQWSAGLSAVFARREAREIARAIESGTRTSGSAAGLQGANDDLKDELQKYADVFTNGFNRIIELGTRIATVTIKAIELLTPIDEIADLLNDWLGKGEDTTGTFHDYVKDMANRKIDPTNRRPGRPLGGPH